MNSTSISYFARTNHRNADIPFGIRQTDRLSHMVLVGKTGVGKSSLIETLARQDLEAGRGFALLDPHGDLAERVVSGASAEERERLVYLNAPDGAQPYGYNPLRRVREDKIPLAVSGFIETLKKLWPDAWGVRMEHVLRNALYALFEQGEATLPDILKLFVNETYRKGIARRIENAPVRRFWLHEFEQYHYRQKADAIAPIQNKLGALLTDPTLYRILVAPKEDLRFRSMMDEGRALVVNLSKGEIGADSSLILGSLILSTLSLAALSRADSADRRPFFIYVDEFQTITTLMLASMLPELRKYGVGLVLASQTLQALEPAIRSAVLGNVGTLISFRVGAEDAPYLAREFQPTFDVEDLLNLPNHRFYLKLMIDGTPSKAFSANSVLPSPSGSTP
ncbi:MAG: type IV secretion system DNA-binding domain-containing protein [Alphaproteobacteria bacterium]|nr:type IV secretion system DNA-binding domain-containing protein [Alphaproteobacteria bacterium]MBL7097322.1 type IV secretion system DNA-binding domain-containing protein [Alphaproteobacteria bacterium]